MRLLPFTIVVVGSNQCFLIEVHVVIGIDQYYGSRSANNKSNEK